VQHVLAKKEQFDDHPKNNTNLLPTQAKRIRMLIQRKKANAAGSPSDLPNNHAHYAKYLVT
jgi:hypothetical protein